MAPMPDFTQYSLKPDAAYAAINGGYSGTMMFPYAGKIADDVAWGLVDILRSKRVDR